MRRPLPFRILWYVCPSSALRTDCFGFWGADVLFQPTAAAPLERLSFARASVRKSVRLQSRIGRCCDWCLAA
ncbi:hypothetical protein B0J12DRAFT_668401 [Macrophomina phaseolina]|uniref:Secreted protein n=1 Tax=Macrophomina phaseolina TaxID=35725 RepID=A0ABQ8G752_9PEZI|nr:hypothetical protein B0J12DRAFT_668401 [Macrophomina phaseolina]